MPTKLFLGVLAALVGAGAGYAATVQTVDQKDLAFSVSTLVISRGTIVRFTNSDKTAHNILITGGGGRVNGGLQQSGVAFSAPFAKAGAYSVTCGIHPRMKLRVVVK